MLRVNVNSSKGAVIKLAIFDMRNKSRKILCSLSIISFVYTIYIITMLIQSNSLRLLSIAVFPISLLFLVSTIVTLFKKSEDSIKDILYYDSFIYGIIWGLINGYLSKLLNNEGWWKLEIVFSALLFIVLSTITAMLCNNIFKRNKIIFCSAITNVLLLGCVLFFH